MPFKRSQLLQHHPTSAQFEFIKKQNDSVLKASGNWTVRRISGVTAERGKLQPDRIDISGLERIDSAGALALFELADGQLERISPLEDPAKTLLEQVAAKYPQWPETGGERGAIQFLRKIGAAVTETWNQSISLLGFLGLTLTSFFASLVRPSRLRLTSLTHHMEQTGIDAIPIVALLAFMIGAVISFLGASVLRQFGGEIFVVELLGFAFLREFGVLLTAILVAGRSGSAFAAQIGSMKSNEEIDAIMTLGRNPMDLLVVPRMLALVLMLPILVLVSDLVGITGGMLMSWIFLGIDPGAFLLRLQETVDAQQFFVGLSKAPVFAMVIAVVGCHEGFRVTGSAASVGERTTSAVVQSIFLVILLDALFAVFYEELGI